MRVHERIRNILALTKIYGDARYPGWITKLTRSDRKNWTYLKTRFEKRKLNEPKRRKNDKVRDAAGKKVIKKKEQYKFIKIKASPWLSENKRNGVRSLSKRLKK